MSSHTSELNKRTIEIFSEELNSWISFSINEFYSVLQNSGLIEEDELFTLKTIPSLTVKSTQNQSASYHFKKDDYIEFERDIFCEIYFDISNHNIIIKDEANAKFKQNFKSWARAKIISTDPYLVEYEDTIYQINSMHKVRALTSENSMSKRAMELCLESISNVPLNIYNSIKEIISNDYCEYSQKENELVVIAKKGKIVFIKELLEMKRSEQEEIEKYNTEIAKEKDNLNKMKEILKNSMKEIFVFHQKFKDFIEEKIKNIKDIRYTILSNDLDSDGNKKSTCTLIVFSNRKEVLSEIRNNCPFKQEVLQSEKKISEETMKTLVNKSKIDSHYYDQQEKKLFILGNEKSINDFKIIWNITMKYSQKIEETKKESEIIKKELSTLKKQYNIK